MTGSEITPEIAAEALANYHDSIQPAISIAQAAARMMFETRRTNAGEDGSSLTIDQIRNGLDYILEQREIKPKSDDDRLDDRVDMGHTSYYLERDRLAE